MEKVKEVLELLYLLSGPALVFFAYKALEQIRVTKELAKINAKREAYKAAVDECKYYSEKIMPLINKLDSKVSELDIQMFKKSQVTIEPSSVSVVPFVDYAHHETAMEQIVPELLDVSNALSDFSAYFMSGIADEKLAYKSLSTTYCYTVKKYTPIFIQLADDEDSVFQLFLIWSARKEKETALAEKRALEEKIEKTRDLTVRPIGT